MAAPKCPHCQADIEGFVPQASFVERLNDKEKENKAMQAALTVAQAKVKDFDAIASELDGLKTADQRRAAFESAGIPDAARPGFEVMYRSTTAGLADDKRPTFTDWLAAEETKAHPLLASHFAKPAGEEPPPPSPPKPLAQPAPKIDTGIVHNTGSGKGGPKNHAELQAYFRSQEYLGLPYPEQTKIRNELQAKVPATM